jgi:hypothetical protein
VNSQSLMQTLQKHSTHIDKTSKDQLSVSKASSQSPTSRLQRLSRLFGVFEFLRGECARTSSFVADQSKSDALLGGTCQYIRPGRLNSLVSIEEVGVIWSLHKTSEESASVENMCRDLAEVTCTLDDLGLNIAF